MSCLSFASKLSNALLAVTAIALILLPQHMLSLTVSLAATGTGTGTGMAARKITTHIQTHIQTHIHTRIHPMFSRPSLHFPRRMTSVCMAAAAAGLSTQSGPPTTPSSPLQPSVGATVDALRQVLAEAFTESYGADKLPKGALLVPTKPEFGDYQSNIAMMVAKELKVKPSDVAARLKEQILKSEQPGIGTGILADIHISGPGFMNFRLTDDYISQRVASMAQSPQRLGVTPAASPQRVVVDYSSPNIAKEMHVGHLRSTIIGDTLARVLAFLGHDVVRLNHVGDWGTQFGMLIRYLKETQPQAISENSGAVSGAVKIGDLVEFYKAAKKRFDADPAFAEAARREVVLLQGGDVASVAAWRAICEVSRKEFQVIYDMLGVRGLEERGESFYNPFLANVVGLLEQEGLAVESEGALCVFLPGYSNADGTPLPLVIRKTDGGYLYASTDLAALKHRVEVERANRILYVTDEGQSQHFAMVFAAARRSQSLVRDRPDVELVHVPFGVVQGEDGKKFKSRSGDTVKLKDLLEEAVRLAEEDFLARKSKDGSSESEPLDSNACNLSEAERRTARTVGIAAVKYADLSMNRESNYRFSYKKMLSLTGNTAPYMLYAYVRIQGISRKAVEQGGLSMDDIGVSQLAAARPADVKFNEPEELALAKLLARFDETVLDVSRTLYPNKLCDYMFELSQKFNTFYEKCPVLKAATPQEKLSRTLLCSVTADVLRMSMGLLGIEVVDQL